MVKKGSKSGVGLKFRQSTTSTAATAAAATSLASSPDVADSPGTRPLAEPATVQHVLAMMGVHLCRKVLYGVQISHRVGVYVVGCLLLSVISDFNSSTAKSTFFFARKENFFNAYFVKFSWGWTVLLLGPFMVVTGFVTGCGSRCQIRNNLVRLAVATAVWFTITGLFNVVEEMTGICLPANQDPVLADGSHDELFRTPAGCKGAGLLWRGLDISGHSFLLTWCNLFIVEEAAAYLGWERIKDAIRNEEHLRSSSSSNSGSVGATSTAPPSTTLSKLTNAEFRHLRDTYRDLTPLVRGLFCGLALMALLWDVMLVSTVLYFHIMVEKVLATCIAVLVWFFLYRVVYPAVGASGLPGQSGPFKYVLIPSLPSKKDLALRGRTGGRGDHAQNGRPEVSKQVPKFMGMPLYALDKRTSGGAAAFDEEESFSRGQDQQLQSAGYQRPLRNRSRSTSRLRLMAANGSSRSSYCGSLNNVS